MRFRGTSRALSACAIVALATTLAPLDAAAHGPKAPTKEPSDKTRAQELFKKSSEAYLRGDFQASINFLDEAYALDPQPVLVYNKARAHEGLGHTDEAITLYEKYLALEPTSQDRGAIEQRVATLKKQRDDKATVEKDKAQVEKDKAQVEKDRAERPPPPPEKKRSVLPYVVAGVGAAGVATGAVFGLMTLSKESAAKSEPVQASSIDLRDKAKTLATVSNVSFVIGGALVAAGVVWWVLDGQRVKRVGIGPGSIVVGGTF